MYRFLIVALCAAFITATGLSAQAHEGHDHAPAPLPSGGNIAARAEAASVAFELVAIAEDGALAIYLDRFGSNEPVEGAALQIETPAGPAVPTSFAPGVFRLEAPWLAKPGRYEIIFTVTAKGEADVLPLTLDIPKPAGGFFFASDQAKDAAPRSGLGWIAAGVGGFLLGVIVMGAARRRRRVAAPLLILALTLAATDAFAHEGEDHSAKPGVPPAPAQSSSAAPVSAGGELAKRLADGSVFVPKPAQRILAIRTALTESGSYYRTVELPGRIIPDPNGSGMVQPSVSGRLSPPPAGFPKLGATVNRGDVLAYVTPPLQAIDVSDMRQRQGELDQQMSIVQQRVARYDSLVKSGAVARVQLDEARLELQGLKDRRAALDRARRDSEPLIAPVPGVIADGTPVAGQMAQTTNVVFHIVDPARLWIEALSFEALPNAQTASARTGSGRSLSLTYQGSGFTDRNQSVPIHFAIEGDVSGLRVGQFVTVLANTSDEQKGVAVPRNSIVRGSNGQDLVYEHVNAERFQPHPVRIEPLDGDRVLIAAGIGAGKRIVTQGAELLDQVR